MFLALSKSVLEQKLISGAILVPFFPQTRKLPAKRKFLFLNLARN